MEALGKPRNGSTTRLRAFAAQLGLDTSHFGYYRSEIPQPSCELPFKAQPAPGSRSGLSVAAKWFLDRGYAVSVPLEPAVYDLIAESDEGLKKVQVKTTRRQLSNGRYFVKLLRTVYDSDAKVDARGRYRQVPYSPGDVDYFFIVTAQPAKYLIPLESVTGRQTLVLDQKYQAFAV